MFFQNFNVPEYKFDDIETFGTIMLQVDGIPTTTGLPSQAEQQLLVILEQYEHLPLQSQSKN